MTVLVTRKAPDFVSAAVLANGDIKSDYKLSDEIKGKYGLVFFYPLDFTFVCPSELIALNNRIAEFHKHNVEVISISVDSHFTHNAWRNTPISSGGIGHLKYTMVSDLSHNIMNMYDVKHPIMSVAFRASFLIDKEQIIRHQSINDLPLGRNMNELLRIIEALQFHEKHGEVCPAGWQNGDEAINPTEDGIKNYLKSQANNL